MDHKELGKALVDTGSWEHVIQAGIYGVTEETAIAMAQHGAKSHVGNKMASALRELLDNADS